MKKNRVVETVFGSFDRSLAQKLQVAYEKALQETKESFIFTVADGRDHPILTKLAKYLVEYFENEGLLKTK